MLAEQLTGRVNDRLPGRLGVLVAPPDPLTGAAAGIVVVQVVAPLTSQPCSLESDSDEDGNSVDNRVNLW